MENLINNYINGNLEHAKKQAKRFKLEAIRAALIEDYGYTLEKATRTAEYLKGHGPFQAACNVE